MFTDSEARVMSETKSDKSGEPSKKLNDEQLKDAKRPSIIHVILLNRTVRILSALGVFCMLLPIVDYFYFYSTEITEYQIDDSGICSHYPIYQIPCGGEHTTEADCIRNSCCFSTTTGCYHFLPSKYQFRVDRGRPWGSGEDLLPTKDASPLGTKSFSRLKLDIEEIDDETLSIAVRHPNEASSTPRAPSIRPKYAYNVFSPEMFVEVKRLANNKTLLTTARGALIAGENYFEWSVHLNSLALMGFDGLHVKAGQRILINNEHSSVVPYVIAFDRESKHYHAVHFESIDGPAEIQILKSNVIIIRQFHSSSFRLTLFVGSGYSDVHRQIIKQLPRYMPKEHWPHGVHMCPSTVIYNASETRMELEHLLASVELLPFDSHCIYDELAALIVSRNDSERALDDYRDIIERLFEHQKKLQLHIALSVMEESTVDAYQRAVNDQLFLVTDDPPAHNFAGIYGTTRKVFYFDYITKSTEIADLLARRWDELAGVLNFTAGIFLHRSFPNDDTADKSMKFLDTFEFQPKNFKELVEQLVPLDVRTRDGKLLIHQLNNFGRRQIEVFQKLNVEDEKFCVTDSYREDSSCAMLIREPTPSWLSFQSIVHQTVFYSVIGMPFYGAEVCGSSRVAVQEDLCIRWYQFAIFSPLFYVDGSKSPLKFTKYAERIMIHAIRTRYELLSYMRAFLMRREPLLRPLRLEYPEIDENFEEFTANQFMFGASLMIAPVMEPQVVELALLFPEKYFEFWSGFEMPRNTTHFSVVMLDIPIFIRAGHIVATNLAYESLSAEASRRQPYILVVALACTERFTCHSRGKLVVVEEHLEFSLEASEKHLNITVITRNPSESRKAVCDPERFASGEFVLAKIYGLGEFKAKYRNDYLSLDLNICDDADWNETFSFSI